MTAWFVWIKTQRPQPEPQRWWNCDDVPNDQRIIAKHELKGSEAGLSLDELTALYPPPAAEPPLESTKE